MATANYVILPTYDLWELIFDEEEIKEILKFFFEADHQSIENRLDLK